MNSVRMHALRKFSYGRLKLNSGDRFVVENEKHALVLSRSGLAMIDDEQQSVDDNVVSEPPIVDQSEFTTVTLELIAEAPKRSRGRPKGAKNKYRRRDMVAE